MKEDYMRIAIEEARKAEERNEVPIGAVIVDKSSGTLIARAGNRTRELKDPTAHAEILAIRAACEKAGAQRIPDCDLYVTLEPCPMCAAAISFARIHTLHIGARDEKSGGVLRENNFYTQKNCHHKPAMETDICAEECSTLLKNFFAKKREEKKLA